MPVVRAGERRQSRARRRHEHAEHPLLRERIGRLGDNHRGTAGERVRNELPAVLLEAGHRDEALARGDLPRVGRDAGDARRHLTPERTLR